MTSDPQRWKRHEMIGLAAADCVHCGGLGAYAIKNSRGIWAVEPVLCGCVYRQVFRRCLAKYRALTACPPEIGGRSLYKERGVHAVNRRWAVKPNNEDYIADFTLMARRCLNVLEMGVWRLYHLDGLDWRRCCQALRMDKGNFFHSVYRVEVKLGKVYSTTKPYALFPFSDYFGTHKGKMEPCAAVQPAAKVMAVAA